jgi:hypothetical protein
MEMGAPMGTAKKTDGVKNFPPTEATEPAGKDVDAERLAATIVALWRAENGDDSQLVAHVKNTLLGARSTARANAIRECVERLGQFGRQIRKVDAIAALESLAQKEK